MHAQERIAGLVLAAGRSTRMGTNKLLCTLAGKPLVAHAADAALDAALDPVCVVTGHESSRVRSALGERRLGFAHNREYAAGMASSLRAGLAALSDHDCAAVVVLLGDMPRVRAEHVRRLVAAFAAAGPNAICVAEYAGVRGNPVLWPACDFAALAALEGDTGGRALLAASAKRVRQAEMPDDGVLVDADSPEMLATLGAEAAR